MPLIPTWLVSSLTALAPSLAWREVGGPAIAFTFLRTFVFGKQLRTVEYPHGDLKTISVRLATLKSIKKHIAIANGIVNPTDIKQVYRYEDNFWTEELLTAKDIRYLSDNNWVLWTRSHAKIPSKNVNMKELNSIDSMKNHHAIDEEEDFVLKTAAQVVAQSTAPIVDPKQQHTTDKTATTTTAQQSSSSTTSSSSSSASQHKDKPASDLYSDRYKISLNAVKISAMNYVSQCRNESFLNGEVEGGPLTEREYQVLIDLLLDESSYIISLYHNFKDDPKLFVKYARKKAQDVIKREEEKKGATANKGVSKADPATVDSHGFVGPQMEWDVISEETKRKKKIEHLIHEYKTGKNLVEEIKHPETPQNDKKEKEQTTQTAQVTTTI